MKFINKYKFILKAALVFCLLTCLYGCGIAMPQGRTLTINTGQKEEDGKSITSEGEVIRLDGEEEQDSGEGQVSDEGQVSGTVAGTEPTDDSGLSITMLNVGQGLAILIEADGHYMMYDGGGRDSSSYVFSYIKGLGVEKFECLIASHYDEDHIAGLVGLLRNYKVSNVLCPDYQADTKIYNSLQNAISENGAGVIHPNAGERYLLGSAEITVLGPISYDEETENNNSIVIKLSYGDFSCILSGDAEKEEELAIVESGADISADLYVVGHHGSSGSTSDEFLKAISPSAAWISCGADNSYGHPAAKTMEKLKKAGILIYRTDKTDSYNKEAENKTEVTCYSDGSTFRFDQEACTDYSPGAKN